MSGYAFHPDARGDLDEIWHYIAADNLDAADRVITEILDAIRAVVPFPHSGHRCPDLTARPLRFLIVREYLIAYAPDEKPLWCRTRADRLLKEWRRKVADADRARLARFNKGR
jgi:plasmid stabilization system protein ParE